MGLELRMVAVLGLIVLLVFLLVMAAPIVIVLRDYVFAPRLELSGRETLIVRDIARYSPFVDSWGSFKQTYFGHGRVSLTDKRLVWQPLFGKGWEILVGEIQGVNQGRDFLGLSNDIRVRTATSLYVLWMGFNNYGYDLVPRWLKSLGAIGIDVQEASKEPPTLKVPD